MTGKSWVKPKNSFLFSFWEIRLIKTTLISNQASVTDKQIKVLRKCFVRSNQLNFLSIILCHSNWRQNCTHICTLLINNIARTNWKTKCKQKWLNSRVKNAKNQNKINDFLFRFLFFPQFNLNLSWRLKARIVWGQKWRIHFQTFWHFMRKINSSKLQRIPVLFVEGRKCS